MRPPAAATHDSANCCARVHRLRIRNLDIAEDDDDDFFDAYDSRRVETQDSRNRDLQRSDDQFRGA